MRYALTEHWVDILPVELLVSKIYSHKRYSKRAITSLDNARNNYLLLYMRPSPWVSRVLRVRKRGITEQELAAVFLSQPIRTIMDWDPSSPNATILPPHTDFFRMMMGTANFDNGLLLYCSRHLIVSTGGEGMFLNFKGWMGGWWILNMGFDGGCILTLGAAISNPRRIYKQQQFLINKDRILTEAE